MTTVRSTVAAALFAVVTVVITTNGVMTGSVWLSRAFRSVDGLAPALIISGVVLGVLLFALILLLMTGLVLIEIVVGAPRIRSHGTYSLLGVFTIVGVFVSLNGVVTVFSLDSMHVTGSTPDVSLAAWTAFSSPVVLVCSRLIAVGDSWRTDFSAEAGDDVEPVTSKRIHRGGLMSESHSPQMNDGETGNPGVDDRDPVLDAGDWEYNWTIGTDVGFTDIGGMDDVIDQLRRDVIRPVTGNRERADRLGIAPSNVLLHGPPGTGKTFLAKALASELGLPFTNLTGGDIQSKWINESADCVRVLFEEAERLSERHGGAVLFIDEIDTVLSDRESARSHEEDRKTVNEFLRHLQDRPGDSIVVGATNRLASLDDAAIRSGRFDTQLRIGEPDLETRKAILRAQLRARPHAVSSVIIDQVAERTEGCVAADIASIVDDAANLAFDRSADQIRDEDLLAVVDHD